MPDVLGVDPKQYWSAERVEVYDRARNIKVKQEEMTREALSLLKPGKKDLILDAGCGTGFSTEVISEHNHVIGLDVSKAMLEKASGRIKERVCADIRELPFKNDSFKGIISISTLQWVWGRDYAEVVEAYRQVASEFRRVSAKTVIQFYPSSKQELDLVIDAFKKEKFRVEHVKSTATEKEYLVCD